jgi:hypothetical protein
MERKEVLYDRNDDGAGRCNAMAETSAQAFHDPDFRDREAGQVI